MTETVNRARAEIGRVALGDIIHRSGRRFKDRLALIDGDASLTYTQLNERSNQFAHFLLGKGFQAGDKIGMLCNNSIDMVVAFLGIQKAGLVWVPINILLDVSAMTFIFNHAEIKYLVIDETLLARADLHAEIQSMDIPTCAVLYPGQTAQPGRFTLSQAVIGQPAVLPIVHIDGKSLTQIMYTSGTTGPQKGVMHSHESVHASLMAIGVELFNEVGKDVMLCMLPLFHCAQHCSSFSGLMVGATIVLQRGFDPTLALNAIHHHRVTMMLGLPMMYRAMLEHPEFPSKDLSAMRYCMYAMAPFPSNVLERLLNEFCPTFALGSGQTEMYPMATVFEPHYQGKKMGCYWGVATVQNELAVMDEHGNLLGPNQVGEIVFRGPNVMLGYYKDPEATERAQRFGWHHTGDLGSLDEDGLLLFVDRMKDMIKTGGENVASIKVEEVLLRHSDIANAAVIGLPHEHWVEAVTAFVTVKPGLTYDEASLVSHCKEYLGAYEVPKAFILLNEFPATSTGKIQKFELRKLYLDHYA